MRRCIFDILNIEVGPLAAVPRAPWHVVETQVRRLSRGATEADANIGVAKGLYHFATTNCIAGRRHDIFPLNIGVSEKVIYWSPAVIRLRDRPAVLFIDPRRMAKKLTDQARVFVFSVMHERCLVDPDLSGVDLCIMQFTSEPDGKRTPTLHFSDGVALFDFEALDCMVQETYAIWNEILEERDAATRRGTGTAGPLV